MSRRTERTADASIEAVRRAVEERDLPRLVGMLAPDVVFHRPATIRPVVGREHVAELLTALLEIFQNFRYVASLDGSGDGAEPFATVAGAGTGAGVHGLVFRAEVEGEPVEGIDLISFNAEGQLSNFVVMMRPLAAVLAIADAVGTWMTETAGSVR
ncbi:nuclear transport factor 2 family protein [Plantactinospora siamensis]|uniref:Nuclear transport factor 2 family protein n=1 Tax=Plantactinospora siamensis TaxID=555372 RepID=A0ABV6NWS3_9ACTN